jgi:hypothetical protein
VRQQRLDESAGMHDDRQAAPVQKSMVLRCAGMMISRYMSGDMNGRFLNLERAVERR